MQCNKFIISTRAASALTEVYTFITRSTLTFIPNANVQNHHSNVGISRKLSIIIYEQPNTSTPLPPHTAVLLFCYYVRHLAIWRLHIPAKLKQEGQKYIFQFSRCESFHLVIQMSLVFCVNRCPHPASFISIS